MSAEPLPPPSPASSPSVPPPPPPETEGAPHDAPPPSEPPAPDPFDVWLPIRPAADFLGVGPRRLNICEKAGEIPARKRGLFGWKFRENDLMAYVEKAAGIAPPPATAEHDAPRASGMAAIMSEAVEKERQAEEAREARYYANQSPLVRMVNAILVSAIEGSASDLHIEPSVRNARVRNRVNGTMREVMAMPLNLRDGVTRRFCVMGNLDPFGKHLQIGRIPIKHYNRDYSLRILATPTVLGLNLTLRILRTTPPALNALGMSPDVQEAVEYAAYPYGGEGGLLLFSGPTGSGLTTTAAAVLNKLNSIEKKLVALVPVVEYEMGGIGYIPVQSEIGVGDVGHHRRPTISEALSALLHGGDTDIVFLGDIVGPETARAALLASESGLKVLATINAPTPSLALRRIAEWTKAPQERALRACHGVLMQRLVRRLPAETKVAKQMTADEIHRWLPFRATNLSYTEPNTVWEPDRAAPGPTHDGWAGRTGVFAFGYPQELDEPDRVRFALERDVVYKVTNGFTALEEGYAALR